MSIDDVPKQGASRRSSRALSLLSHAIKGFSIDVDDGDGVRQLICREVRGFREAMMAAADPQAPMPARLVLVVPEIDLGEWLRCWSEDCERIRRTLTVRRLFDGRTVTAVATLASYGTGIDTSLGIESITTTFRPCALVRSGVHSKAVARHIGVAIDVAIDDPAARPPCRPGHGDRAPSDLC